MCLRGCAQGFEHFNQSCLFAKVHQFISRHWSFVGRPTQNCEQCRRRSTKKRHGRAGRSKREDTSVTHESTSNNNGEVMHKSFVVIKIHLSWPDIYESPSVLSPRARGESLALSRRSGWAIVRFRDNRRGQGRRGLGRGLSGCRRRR